MKPRGANTRNPRLAKALARMSKDQLIELVEAATWSALYLEHRGGVEPSEQRVAEAIAMLAHGIDQRRGVKTPRIGTRAVTLLAVEEAAVVTTGAHWVEGAPGDCDKGR